METITVGKLDILTPQLVGARIGQSHLIGVTLADAAWRNVTVYGCVLERVDLTGAHLLDSTVKNVIFDDCRLDYATLAAPRASGTVAWRDTNLANTSLTGCRLPETAFQDCDLRGADLTDNDISSLSGLTSLRGTVLDNGQLLQLAAVAVRDLVIDLCPE